MILDKYISFHKKVIFSVICSGFWIYFRTSNCYELIPRKHIFPILFVMLWTYLNYYEPLFLPIGLIILMIYPTVKNYFNPETHELSKL
jgi:hypothetical protein